MSTFIDTFSTSFGLFSVAVDHRGAVVATAFGGAGSLRKRGASGPLVRAPARIAKVRRQLLAYFAGRRRNFDVPLAPAGTEFQHRVWAALRAIPCGQTRSYGEIAADLGRPRSARAVGRANATNPICVLVPCHRVIGADGALTGFAFGEDWKRRLLALEAATGISARTSATRRPAVTRSGAAPRRSAAVSPHP